jgi:hypothetical protein
MPAKSPVQFRVARGISTVAAIDETNVWRNLFCDKHL